MQPFWSMAQGRETDFHISKLSTLGGVRVTSQGAFRHPAWLNLRCPNGMLDSMDIPMGMGFWDVGVNFQTCIQYIGTKKPSISSCQPVGNLHTDIIYSRWLQFKHQKKKHFLFRSYLYPVSFHLLPLTKRNPPKLEKSLPKPRHTRPAKPGLVLFWVAKA